ncbi:hypothetical protein [Deinococcus misasensis]|uniref:hypothetical protein n=1 Tax=Deinococcus misasensis TaxID=392413 RepID=UPI00054ED255|nr:hypothetical protein [Deinococcus misasensis]
MDIPENQQQKSLWSTTPQPEKVVFNPNRKLSDIELLEKLIELSEKIGSQPTLESQAERGQIVIELVDRLARLQGMSRLSMVAQTAHGSIAHVLRKCHVDESARRCLKDALEALEWNRR